MSYPVNREIIATMLKSKNNTAVASVGNKKVNVQAGEGTELDAVHQVITV